MGREPPQGAVTRAAQGLSRHSALREGGKSKVTKNAAEAKPDGKTKSPSGGMPEGPKIGTKKNPPPKDGERESISMSDAGEPQEIRFCVSRFRPPCFEWYDLV